MFVVKVPGINGLGKTKGCEKAGSEILKVLREDKFSNESGREVDVSKFTLDSLKLDDSDLEKNVRLIYDKSFESFESKPFTLFLGGDHSVSYPLVRGFLDSVQNSGKEPCLVVFDAHADCDYPNQEPTHEEWLRKVIEEGFPSENILLVGVRKIWENELGFLREKGVKIMPMNSLLENLHECCDVIMEFSRGKELYVSLDIDVIDPAFAPGTGYLEGGGLSSREFLYLLSRIYKLKNLRGFDLVEINPDKDRDNLTTKLGAKILSELV